MNPQLENCLKDLHGSISDAVFNDLFAKLELANVTDRRVTVLFPADKDVKAYLPYKMLLEMSWQKVTGQHLDFEFQHPESKPSVAMVSNNFCQSLKLAEEFSFENFVVGDKSK